MNWLLSREYLADEDNEILLATDEVVVTRSARNASRKSRKRRLIRPSGIMKKESRGTLREATTRTAGMWNYRRIDSLLKGCYPGSCIR